MKKERIRKVLKILGILLILVYAVVMIYEIKNFSPYNKGMFLFADRALEFLLPAILCFIVRFWIKEK